MTVSKDGIVEWNARETGLYAAQFTITDKFKTTNVLDIMFEVKEFDANPPVFVKDGNSRDPIGSQDDGDGGGGYKVCPGETKVVSVWAYDRGGIRVGIKDFTTGNFAYDDRFKAVKGSGCVEKSSGEGW